MRCLNLSVSYVDASKTTNRNGQQMTGESWFWPGADGRLIANFLLWLCNGISEGRKSALTHRCNQLNAEKHSLTQRIVSVNCRLKEQQRRLDGWFAAWLETNWRDVTLCCTVLSRSKIQYTLVPDSATFVRVSICFVDWSWNPLRCNQRLENISTSRIACSI